MIGTFGPRRRRHHRYARRHRAERVAGYRDGRLPPLPCQLDRDDVVTPYRLPGHVEGPSPALNVMSIWTQYPGRGHRGLRAPPDATRESGGRRHSIVSETRPLTAAASRA